MHPSNYTKTQSILAFTGVIILVLLYICTLIFSLMKHEYAKHLFLASLAATVAVPLMIHFLMMMINVKRGKGIFDNPYPYRDKEKK